MLLLSLELLTSLGPAVVRTGLPRARCAPVHMSIALPEEGLEVEVVCERVAYGGMGIARTETGATVMLSRAVPGDKVRALVTRRRRRHVEAAAPPTMLLRSPALFALIFRLLHGLKGYGLKYRGARMQPLTRGPEADETKTMTVTLPHRV